uniref:EGF_CA domain-containing protein n=1 Tax=Macrostomum lignano TaxID=282301 RepID=A0A1I8JRL3_9PLAT
RRTCAQFGHTCQAGWSGHPNRVPVHLPSRLLSRRSHRATVSRTVDECLATSRPPPCPAFEQCLNTIGSYHCRTIQCPAGYVYDSRQRRGCMKKGRLVLQTAGEGKLVLRLGEEGWDGADAGGGRFWCLQTARGRELVLRLERRVETGVPRACRPEDRNCNSTNGNSLKFIVINVLPKHNNFTLKIIDARHVNQLRPSDNNSNARTPDWLGKLGRMFQMKIKAECYRGGDKPNISHNLQCEQTEHFVRVLQSVAAQHVGAAPLPKPTK